MKCPKCNSEIKKGALFCTQCGTRLFDSENDLLFENIIKDDAEVASVITSDEKENIIIKEGNNKTPNDITSISVRQECSKQLISHKKSKVLYVIIIIQYFGKFLPIN